MKKIEWHSRLNVGVKQIDEQHKWLVQLVNNLLSAIQSGVAEDILQSICQELVDYTEFHFRDEELLMEEIGFPFIEEQRAEHEELRVKVGEFNDAVLRGDHIPPKEVLDFLSEWLINHLLHSDMKIGHHIKAQREQEKNQQTS